MPSNTHYVALRYLKVGDRTVAPGEEVPPEGIGRNARVLVDGGYLAAYPVLSDDQEPSGGTSAPDQPEEAGEAGEEPTEPDPADEVEEEDTEEDGDDQTGVTSSGYDPSEHNVEDVVAYAEENMDELDEIIAAETDGRGRKTLLAQLQTLSGE